MECFPRMKSADVYLYHDVTPKSFKNTQAKLEKHLYIGVAIFKTPLEISSLSPAVIHK